uniref:Macaca fascicularis brain cDNA clone: QflA-22958, similar to human kringle containing transmembrane protein 1 (KREMEN1),transcript variant 2, mRNA, RefSeq: NM_032045.3 n=1 Tax=Macaca fascicularis TaxID=9541 RepID=I7GNY7_MACFA|nr:unnamed protein product [Macaca fascicularis]
MVKQTPPVCFTGKMMLLIIWSLMLHNFKKNSMKAAALHLLQEWHAPGVNFVHLRGVQPGVQ